MSSENKKTFTSAPTEQTEYASLMQSLTEEVNDIKKYGEPKGKRITLEIMRSLNDKVRND